MPFKNLPVSGILVVVVFEHDVGVMVAPFFNRSRSLVGKGVPIELHSSCWSLLVLVHHGRRQTMGLPRTKHNRQRKNLPKRQSDGMKMNWQVVDLERPLKSMRRRKSGLSRGAQRPDSSWRMFRKSLRSFQEGKPWCCLYGNEVDGYEMKGGGVQDGFVCRSDGR